MQVLIQPSTTPPGGWRYVDPANGFEYNQEYGSGEHGKKALCEHVRAYREANQMKPIEGLEAVVEDWICQQSMSRMSGCCREDHRTLKERISGGKALMQTFTTPDWQVPDAQAKARALLCLNCPMNGTPPNVSPQEKLENDAANSRTEAARAQIEGVDWAGLNQCGICRCPLKAKVFFAHALLRPFEPHQALVAPKNWPAGKDGVTPLTCWMVQDVQPAQP